MRTKLSFINFKLKICDNSPILGRVGHKYTHEHTVLLYDPVKGKNLMKSLLAAYSNFFIGPLLLTVSILKTETDRALIPYKIALLQYIQKFDTSKNNQKFRSPDPNFRTHCTTDGRFRSFSGNLSTAAFIPVFLLCGVWLSHRQHRPRLHENSGKIQDR